MNIGPTLTNPVVSSQWLADYLGADNLVVLDASVFAFAQSDNSSGYRSGREAYLAEGHVPGAGFVDVIDDLSDPEGAFPFTRPSPDHFAAAVGRLGVTNETTVVVYDALVGQWAARVWWLFRSFGYNRVAVLDGGLTTWLFEERPIDLGQVSARPAKFTAVERPELWVDKAFIESVLRGEADATLICATPPKEFSGESMTRPRAGHIPGSLSVPAASLVDAHTHALSPAADLRRVFGPAVLPVAIPAQNTGTRTGTSTSTSTSKLSRRGTGAAGVTAPASTTATAATTGPTAPRIVVYCGGGIAAAAAALALAVLGEQSVALYDGSLNEWAADPAAALAVSA